jgi:hypothetical protein
VEILSLVRSKLARMVKMQCNYESISQFATVDGLGLCYPFTYNQNSFSPVVRRFLEHFKNSLNASFIGVRQDGVLGFVDEF